jgi:GT2 family glycosyltransferase
MKTSRPAVTVVLPSHNEGDFVRMTVEGILSQTDYPNYQIVIVDDASTDGSCDNLAGHSACKVVKTGGLGVAGARNFGAHVARGEILVFLDAHCLVSGNWLTRMVDALMLQQVGVVGPCFTRLGESEPKAAGMTWIDDALQTAWGYPRNSIEPYHVPFVPGGCQAFRKSVFSAIGGYEPGFKRWGYEDIEICLRLWLLGYEVVVDPQITIGHHFRTAAAFEMQQQDLAFNLMRMVHLHFEPKRIRRVIRAIDGVVDMEPVLTELFETDVQDRRTALFASRVRTDAWFFSNFMSHLS